MVVCSLLCMSCMCTLAYTPFLWLCVTDCHDSACLEQCQTTIRPDAVEGYVAIRKQPERAFCPYHQLRL